MYSHDYRHAGGSESIGTNVREASPEGVVLGHGHR